MQAQTLTPFELFGNQFRYLVPRFQRPYVWNKADQWEPLWNDVRIVAERVLEQFESGPLAPGTVAPHFLGAIVLDQQLVPAGFIGVRHVVDGQQRLTTLQLLLDAAQWVVHKHGNPMDASALGNLVLNNATITHHRDEVFKVWPSAEDRAAFRAVMSDSEVLIPELSQAPIAAAHRYFKEEIREWADTDGDRDKARDRLHALTMTLMQYLKIVVIDLEEGDNAQVIFETLNARGTPLLAADLVKNLVFRLAELEDHDLDQLYEERWKPFDSHRWRRKIKQGRLFRPRIDVFLNYWLTMKQLREVATDRIYPEFESLVRQSSGRIEQVVNDLVAGSMVYDSLEEQPWTSREGTFYHRALRVMEAFVWGPYLLWLFSRGDELTDEQRALALDSLESWLVRRMICRMPSKQTNQMVLDLLKKVDETGPVTAGSVTSEFLARQTADSRIWPNDQDVIQSVLSFPLYRNLTRSRLRMMLEALEDDLRTPLSEEEHVVRGKLTVEHVMPQGWREHWPHPTTEEEVTEREILVHALGNLTLVNNRLNPALSNRPWTDDAARARTNAEKGKRSILADHSVLRLNRQIIDRWPHAWDEQSIRERGQILAHRICEIWGRPTTT